MIRRSVFLFCIAFSISSSVVAGQDSYFLDIVEQSAPDEETITKARTQLEELKEIKLHPELKLQPFHKQGKGQIPESKVYCNGCHLPLPHRKTLRTRAFLNMHIQYVACETCHYRPENQKFNYKWLDYASYKAVDNPTSLLHSGLKQDDKTTIQPRTGLIRIAPFLQDTPVPATREQTRAKEIYEQWKTADLDTKARIKAKIHLPLEKKGPECVSCHDDQDTLLDLVELGATASQVKAIEHNTIADFFKHYQPEKEEKSNEPKPDDKEQRIRITDLLD